MGQMVGSLQGRCARPAEAHSTHEIPTHETHEKQTSLAVAGNAKKAQMHCPVCPKGDHMIYRCAKFMIWPVEERRAFLVKQKLCFNCLKAHTAAECKSTFTCRVCKGRHNTLIHQDRRQTAVPSSSNSAAGSQPNESAQKTATLAVDETAMMASPSHAEKSTLHETKSREQTALKAAAPRANQSEWSTMVILATAIVNVVDRFGRTVPCRALLDGGSTLNFMCARVAEQLGLKCAAGATRITGIGGVQVQCKKVATCMIKSRVGSFAAELQAHVVPKITTVQPKQFVDIEKLNIPADITLADPQFGTPQKIDLLLGAEIFYQTLKAGRILLPTASSPTVVQESELGWLITGTVPVAPLNQGEMCHMVTATGSETDAEEEDESLEGLLKRFWTVENPEANAAASRSVRDEECERFFLHTIRQDSDGRFIARLPFRRAPELLGETFSLAKRWCEQLERRLAKDSALRIAYCESMRELERSGHMHALPSASAVPEPHFFTPHHCVVRPEASSTQVRVVFNAAAKSTTGLSLNDVLHVGPQIQPELFEILIRFRLFPVVVVADIAKMFRQIVVDPADAAFQLIVWRNSRDEEFRIYQVDRLMFGLACSPYVATRSLALLAEKHMEEFPAAARAVIHNTYMDNILSGAATEEEAIQLKRQLEALLEKGCFPLHKWASNSEKLLNTVNEAEREKTVALGDGSETIKALGLKWDRQDDFRFTVTARKVVNLTKRKLLAEIAKISYDPLGLIAPVTMLAKILMQRTWKLDLEWDTPLPESLKEEWETLVDQLEVLERFRIPRIVVDPQAELVELHEFCDASIRAYGAVVYVRSRGKGGKFNINLLAAKSRVAPSKSQTQSLARLELCGALMAAELVQRVRQSFECPIESYTYWTDSEIVIHWIAAEADRWPTFVRNRVAKIQRLSSKGEWRFVPGKENPADLLSRGAAPAQFLEASWWIRGPDFLWQDKDHWPRTPETRDSDHLALVAAVGQPKEVKLGEIQMLEANKNKSESTVDQSSVNSTIDQSKVDSIIDQSNLNSMVDQSILNSSVDQSQFNSTLEVNKSKQTQSEEIDFISGHKFAHDFPKLVRNTALVMRFVHNLQARRRKQKESIRIGPLSISELDKATFVLVKIVQKIAFLPELKSLQQGKVVPNGSRLRTLLPTLDSNGIIRVGGRLQNADLQISQKQPIILPSNHAFTIALAEHWHRMHMHTGPRNLLAHLRHRYWPLRGLELCRKVVNRCLQCFRVAPKMLRQMMGQLPAIRVQPARPFLVTGIDFAGPFWLSPGGRGRVLIKSYICLFVCMVSKAIHLEVTSDLSTKTFLEALQRFSDRRGVPRELHTDNMKGFIGAANELKQIQDELERGEGPIARWSDARRIEWHFIPARAPHHGGIWEANVKQVKLHLKRVAGLAHLTREEFETLLTRIEAVLNSRPLQALSEDPADVNALTPAHFLIGQPLTTPPETTESIEKLGRLTRYQRLSALKTEFWNSWRRSYLHDLQQASKWTAPENNIQVGTLVIIHEEDVAPLEWKLGRVEAVHPGKTDGKVRVVTLRTTNGLLVRDVRRLAPLPVKE